MGSTAHEQRRQSMLDIDLRGRGVLDERVLAAMAAVPRDRFVPADLVDSAYADRPLPIACGQTISQPFIVAAMAEALDLGPTDTVLEVGTGSGYGAAVLSRLAASVVTTERHPALADAARSLLADLGYDNVVVVTGDGIEAAAEHAPFDGIAVTAAASAVPQRLIDQLADGGRLVMPVGADDMGQDLMLYERSGTKLRQRPLGAVRFVPLIAGIAQERGQTSSS